MAEILETPNQQGDNISFDAYQSYHKEVNENNGYLIRGVLSCVRRDLLADTSLSNETNWK